MARCWNKRPPAPCPVDVVPPSINESLVAFLRAHRDSDARAVAEHFGWSLPNANNHLTNLLRIGIATRKRIDPRKGGKRFAWRLAA